MAEEPAKQTEEKPEAKQAQADTKFLLLVGVLLLMIIVCLALLWYTERKKRLDAEAAVAQYVQAQKNIQAAMMNMPMIPQAGQAAKPVNRQDLVAEQTTLNGKPASIFKVSAVAGRRLGFEPGDLILVAPELPTTTPTAAPATEK